MERIKRIAFLILEKTGIYENGTLNYYNLYIAVLILFIIFLFMTLLGKIENMRRKIQKMEEKNQENLDFIRKVINNSPSMYSVKDRYGEIFLANKSYSEFFHKNIEEIEGKTAKELFAELDYDPEISRKMTKDEIEVIKKRKEKLGIEEKIILPSGEERWFFSNIVPLKMDLGLYYSLRVSTDITERKKAEIALKAAKLEAEKRSVEKGHFMATMSHEIRTPLNGIITMLEQINLKKDERLNLISKEIEIMNISSKRLVEVVENVLSLSKIEYGEVEAEVDEFDLRAEVKNSILLFEEKIKDKKIDILTYIDKEIPALIKGDLVKYHHVITNIFGNALKYTQRGYVLIELKLLSKEENKIFIRTLVKDTGIGISKENHENIFRRFSQVENTIKTINGVGLGLAIAKELVERLGGSISLESEVGEGSVFIVDLPFIFVKENEKFRVKDKELIILSDKAEYMDNYIKNTRNIEGLNIIIVEDIKEFYTVFDQEDILNTYVLVDFEDNIEEIRKIYENFGERFLYIKSSESFNFINENKIVNREFLEEALKNIFGLIKEKNDEKIKNIKNFEKTPIKILLVEDDVINREAFKILLDSLGLREIQMAVDGEEALECYYKDKYDIIFMDLQIPKLDGFEVLKIIREYEEKEEKEKSTIITLTANALEGFREKCLEKGFDDYMTKPLTRDKLFEKIEYYIKNKNYDFEELKNQYYDNDEILRKLFESFMENIPYLKEELENAINLGDNDEISQKLHKLKGAVGNLKENNLIRTIEIMEIKVKNRENIEEVYAKFLKELEYLLRLIKKEM